MNRIGLPNLKIKALTGNVEEDVIKQYRLFYEQLKPLKRNRYVIRNRLATFLTLFAPFLTAFHQRTPIDNKKLKKLVVDLDDFIKESFPEKIYLLFKTTPASTIPEATTSFSELAVSIIWDVYRKISQSEIDQINFQYNLVKKISSCLHSCGLHPSIERRSPELHKRYNVIIEYSVLRKSEFEFRSLISLQTLQDNYLKPYLHQDKLSINGASIAVKKIVRITITSTLLLDEEVKNFMELKGSNNNLEFVRSCRDETNTFFDPLLHIPIDTNQKRGNHTFLEKLITGIQTLQIADTRQSFIKKAKEEEVYIESGFRDWFEIFFKGAGYRVTPEALKGNGRIDLRVECLETGAHIFEFKIWRKSNVKNIATQLISYLSDFEECGYIILINPNKRASIISDYKTIITAEETYYIPGSWKEMKVPGSAFSYFVSQHQYGNKAKTIKHFIYQLYP